MTSARVRLYIQVHFYFTACYSSPCSTNMKCIHTKDGNYKCERMPNCIYELDFGKLINGLIREFILNLAKVYSIEQCFILAGYCHEQRVCDNYTCLTFEKISNGSATFTKEKTADGISYLFKISFRYYIFCLFLPANDNNICDTISYLTMSWTFSCVFITYLFIRLRTKT